MEPTKELDNSTSATKNPLLALKPSSPAPRNTEFKCYYCFLKDHGTRKCNSLLYDESIGTVARDGKLFKLPDNTTIPWDTSRPIKQVVDQYSRNSVQLFSSFGQLVELSPEELRAHKADLAKRNISTWKKKETSATENWTTQGKGIPMEKDRPELLNMANSSLKSSSPDPSSSSSCSFLQLSDNQCQNRFHYTGIQHFPSFLTEEPAKETLLDTHLATEYPGSVEETDQRFSVIHQDTFLSYGGLLTLDYEFSEGLEKFPNRTLPQEENVSGDLGRTEDEEEQDLPTYYFGNFEATFVGMEHHILDTGSNLWGRSLLMDLSGKDRNRKEIQKLSVCLSTKNQFYFISFLFPNHQKWTATLISNMPTKDSLHQSQLSRILHLFLSSQLMGTSAKLGEGLTTRSLELKHFCCQKPAPEFLIICLKTSVLECGKLLQNSHPEAFHNLPLTRLKFAFRFDGIGTSKLQFRKCCCQESPLENVLNWALTVWIKTFLGLGLPEGIDWFQNDMSHKTKFARGAWVDQASKQVARGRQTKPLAVGQVSWDRFNPIFIKNDNSAAGSRNKKAQQETTYSVNIGNDITATCGNLCGFRVPVNNIIQLMSDRAQTSWFGCWEALDNKAIDVARKQVCSVLQTGYQFAISQGWRMSSLEAVSRKDSHTESSRRRRNKRSKSEGAFWELNRLTRIQMAMSSNRNHYLRRHQKDRLEVFTNDITMNSLYRLVLSFLGYHSFIFLHIAFVLICSLICLWNVWAPPITLSLRKHWKAVSRIQETCLKGTGIDDGNKQDSLKAFCLLPGHQSLGIRQLGFFPQWNCAAPPHCCTAYGRQAISSNHTSPARKDQTH
jgi:hypothetical protein